MNLIVCEHRDAGTVGRACEHLLLKRVGGEYYPSQEHFRYFTGRGIEFILLCRQCSERSDHGEPFWKTICESCVQDMACGSRLGDLGDPQILVRDSGFKLEHQVVPLSTSNIRAAVIEPLKCSAANSWIILTVDHELIEFDATKPSLSTPVPVSEMGLATDQQLSLHVSKDGRFVAITHTHGRMGVVFDRNTRRISMRLTRGEYYPEHCKFPVAFFEHNGRQLLMHSTDWNRLDVSDPESGELLTSREPTSYRQGEERPEHYLDYFHCSLRVSPDSEWVADNGWIWHPVGVVRTWSLRQWLTENVWESEDGTSKKSLCSRDYYWDGPLCWADNRTVVIWGLGEDDLLLIPGVRLFDVESGAEKSAFAGPVARQSTIQMNVRGKEQTISQQVGTLVFDRWLFSWLPTGPFSVWDIKDGARLLLDPSFAPLGYHPISKKFISQLPDGTIRLSTLKESM